VRIVRPRELRSIANLYNAIGLRGGISLVLLVLFITAANIDKVVQVFGTRGALAGILFVTLGFSIGWLLGGRDADARHVMALATGQRNIAAALVVAGESLGDPKVVVMVVAVAIFSCLGL
jgi:bile acid:Na+ symporter, BASS family